MSRRITILTSGTRGDVQPLIALGLGLQQAGYAVRVATHAPFQPLVAAYGLEFALVAANPNELLAGPPGRGALVYAGNPLRSLQATMRYLRAARPVFARMIAEAWQVCQDAEALIVTLPTTWGQQIADRLGLPCGWALNQPLSRTSAFPSALQPSELTLGPAYNWLTHLAVEQILWQPWRRCLNQWRRETLGLAPLPFWGPYGQIYAQQIPFLYGFSPQVAPRPADWPAAHVVTGYWFLDRPPDWQPPPGLRDFLAAGGPPVCVGFGSLDASQQAALLPLAIAALAQTGLRAVLLADPAALPAPLPPQLFAIAEAPHDWLFPQVAAAVHHGGAGVTAAALRAGIPSVVVPAGTDQFFWGQRVAALGVGPPAIPRRRLSIEQLSLALRAVTSDIALAHCAALLGRQIRAEDGVGQAVELIQRGF